MRMTPLDIQSHRFSRRIRGFDRDEVEAFLQMVTEDYEALVIENAEQRERIRRLEEQIHQFKNQEKLLRETLTSAQAVSERMHNTAEKECQARVSEAETQALKMTQKAHSEVARLAENIRELRGTRAQIAECLRTTLRTHMDWVDLLAVQEKEEPTWEQKSLTETRPTSRRP